MKLQMGSHYKKSMFDNHVQTCLVEWAEKVKKKKGHKYGRDGSTRSNDGSVVAASLSVNDHKDLPQNGVQLTFCSMPFEQYFVKVRYDPVYQLLNIYMYDKSAKKLQIFTVQDELKWRMMVGGIQNVDLVWDRGMIILGYC